MFLGKEYCNSIKQSDLVETDIQSLHKLSEELHQYNQGISLFHSFCRSSLFPWLAPFTGLVVIIFLFFSPSNLTLPLPPDWHSTDCFFTPISHWIWAYWLLAPPPHIVPWQQEVARFEPAPIYPRRLGFVAGTSSLLLHHSSPSKSCRLRISNKEKQSKFQFCISGGFLSSSHIPGG